jgi:hypothetical protein
MNVTRAIAVPTPTTVTQNLAGGDMTAPAASAAVNTTVRLRMNGVVSGNWALFCVKMCEVA